jgi:predicted transcriptional regulator
MSAESDRDVGTAVQSAAGAASGKITLQDVKDVLEADVITGADMLPKEIAMSCGADLMSDVLSYVKPGSLLLTGLTNEHVVRTAEIADIVAICFVRGKEPAAETIRMAKNQRLPLLKTELPMFESCGRLYRRGMPGCSERRESKG